MNLIPSFSIDHRKLKPGLYVSRIDKTGDTWATTFDVRMKRPNAESAIAPAALHTIEHIVATELRNNPVWKDEIIYWGPMGCLTGNYFIVKGLRRPEEVREPLLDAFRALANWQGDIPGATDECCGNSRLHDLEGAKREAAIYVGVLENLKKGEMEYDRS